MLTGGSLVQMKHSESTGNNVNSTFLPELQL